MVELFATRIVSSAICFYKDPQAELTHSLRFLPVWIELQDNYLVQRVVRVGNSRMRNRADDFDTASKE